MKKGISGEKMAVWLESTVNQRWFRANLYEREQHEQPGFPIYMLRIGPEMLCAASWWKSTRSALGTGVPRASGGARVFSQMHRFA